MSLLLARRAPRQMSQLAMPLLVVNLGCEMTYILEQRLKAQNIPADKACKVLNDVIRTMFDPGYVDKLFAPQDMYTVSQTRKIFDRLAHSSIMRLSESRCATLRNTQIDCIKPVYAGSFVQVPKRPPKGTHPQATPRACRHAPLTFVHTCPRRSRANRVLTILLHPATLQHGQAV